MQNLIRLPQYAEKLPLTPSGIVQIMEASGLFWLKEKKKQTLNTAQYKAQEDEELNDKSTAPLEFIDRRTQETISIKRNTHLGQIVKLIAGYYAPYPDKRIQQVTPKGLAAYCREVNYHLNPMQQSLSYQENPPQTCSLFLSLVEDSLQCSCYGPLERLSSVILEQPQVRELFRALLQYMGRQMLGDLLYQTYLIDIRNQPIDETLFNNALTLYSYEPPEGI